MFKYGQTVENVRLIGVYLGFMYNIKTDKSREEQNYR